jgi:hypothetical protein
MAGVTPAFTGFVPLAGVGLRMESGFSVVEAFSVLFLPRPMKLNPFFFPWGTGRL